MSDDMQDVHDVIANLTAGTSDFAKNQKTLNDMSRNAANANLKASIQTAKFSDQMAQGVQTFAKYNKGFESVFSLFSNHIKLLGGAGIVINSMIDSIEDMTKTYRQLYSVGQTFNGSLMEMSDQAAKAGLPLEMFGRVVVKYSGLMSTMGTKRFVEFNSAVRDSLNSVGNLGMTTEELADFQGGFLDISRKLGTSTVQQSSKFVELAKITSAMSVATGQSRDQIIKFTQEALNTTQAMSSLYQMPVEMRAAAESSMREAFAVFSGVHGEAGGFLSKLSSEGMGAGNQYSSEGQTLINAGMGNLASDMNAMSESIKNGTATVDDQQAMIMKFKDQIGSSMGTLQALSASGNQDAAKLVQMYADGLANYDPQKFKDGLKAQEQQKKFTDFMLTMQTVWEKLLGKFKDGFMTAMEGFLGPLDDLDHNTTINKLGEVFEGLGKAVASLIRNVFTPHNIEMMGNLINTLAGGLLSLAEDFANPNSGLMQAITGLATAGGYVLEAFLGIAGVVGRVAGAFGWLIKPLLEAVMGYKLLKLVFGPLIGGIRKLFGSDKKMVRTMIVEAATVNVNGGGLGGLGGLGGGGAGKAAKEVEEAEKVASKGGFFKRMLGKAGGLFGKMGGMAAGAAGGGLGMLGKMGKFSGLGKAAGLLKGIPGLGTILGGAGVIGSLLSGDMGGAVTNAGYMVPGLGTAMMLNDGASMLTGGRIPSLGDMAAGSLNKNVFGSGPGSDASDAMAGMTDDSSADGSMPDLNTPDPSDRNMSDMLSVLKEMNGNIDMMMRTMAANENKMILLLRKLDTNTQ